MTKIAAALALSLLAGAASAAGTHPPMNAVDSFEPYAAISETAGGKHVVGWFETADGACRMNLLIAEKDDETLSVKPTKIVFAVAAADVAEIQTGDGAAMMVACTADADAVKIARFEAPSM